MTQCISVGTFSKEEMEIPNEHQKKIKANVCYCYGCNTKVVINSDVVREDDFCPKCHSPLLRGIINEF